MLDGHRELLKRALAPGILLALTVVIGAPGVLTAQSAQAGSNVQAAPQSSSSSPTTLDDTIEAGDDEIATPARQLVAWNEFEGPLATFRLGGGLLYEWAAYDQDDESKEQIALVPDSKIRDVRMLFRGGFKFDRPVTWSAGFLFDTTIRRYLTRQTGVMIAVPEISGHIFIGRQKEGFSLNKVMVGYAGWTMERATISDATIPILADGIKWLGYAPKKHLIWNLGVYTDWISEGQSFSTYDRQIAGRIAWVPMMSEETHTVLHIGTSARYGKPNDGALRLRSRPEAFPAPFFVDTGRFEAESTTMIAPEVYYRPGPWLFGSEYFVQKVDAPDSGDPLFHGGDAFVCWLPTGETRVYNTRGGYFDQISPLRPVFDGGLGAWELVARVSYVDLDGGSLEGGRFWRLTPMVNWHLSDNVRLELTYGYGSLSRFNRTGHTQFFQSRLQLQI
jgi:phosphate-selective porin OprO/OprP